MPAEPQESQPQCKVIFRLKQDEDGYPPCGYESVWADRLPDGTCRIDNIPWYAYDAAVGDIVSVREVDGELFFHELVQPSGNSLLRVITYKRDDIQGLREHLRELGCDVELNDRLLAVHVPGEVLYTPIFQYLKHGEEGGHWTFEEAVLCHHDEEPATKRSVRPGSHSRRSSGD